MPYQHQADEVAQGFLDELGYENAVRDNKSAIVSGLLGVMEELRMANMLKIIELRASDRNIRFEGDAQILADYIQDYLNRNLG